MASNEQRFAHRVLLVDDDPDTLHVVRVMLGGSKALVQTAASASEALEMLEWMTKYPRPKVVLITDLHMPNPGDGFTVVSAMRHSQPDAVTLLVSGYPDTQGAMAAILLEADEIIVKPFEIGRLTELVNERMLNRRPNTELRKERVGVILHRCLISIIERWLARAKQSTELNCLLLSDDERTGHLPKLVEDLARRLSQPNGVTKDSDATFSPAAVAHGKLRYVQGYTPAMIVHESRILQVTIFETLQSNLNHLDFSLLLPDVMTIADEVDAQLTQSMDSYMKLLRKSMAA